MDYMKTVLKPLGCDFPDFWGVLFIQKATSVGGKLHYK